MNTTITTPTLAQAPAAPVSVLAAAWALGVAALLVGLAVSVWVAAGRRGVAPTGQAAGAAGMALHLAWPAGAAGAGLEALRWALLLPLVPALTGLWRLAPGRWPRLAVAALGLALVLAIGLDAPTPAPHWMPLAGLLLAAAIWLGWRQQIQAQDRRSAEAAALMQQQFQAQAAELAAARQQMQRALDSAEAAAQARSSFLAAASHDLRQPAHALGLYTAALRAGPLAPEQAEIASRMQASLAALDAMFAALLDVSRIDAGAVAPQWDTVWLAPLLHRLALEWAPQAEARNLRLAVHVSDPLAVTVTDPLLLERVLRNLLANAIKYTRQGGVLLACRSRRMADGTPGWRIEVWDTGIGIPPAEQERVFEEFYQIAGPGRERGQGLGLGLAIVQRLVRLLQLRLVLRSVPGRGSVFLLGGLAIASPSTQRAAEARQAMRQLQGLGVAVLEDDDDVRDAMRRLLTLWGCRVLAGVDAQDLLRRHPDGGPAQALIADLRLADGRLGPDEAGTLAAAWGRSLPLLLVSGETGHAGLEALRQAGQPVLAKPVSPARLRSWLESVATGAQTRSPLDQESP